MTRTFENTLKQDLKVRSRRRRDSLSDQSKADRGRPALRNDLAPALRLETRAVASLTKATRRLRKSDAGHVVRIRNAIAALGFCAPIMISASGDVLDGHARLDAAEQLGL